MATALDDARTEFWRFMPWAVATAAILFLSSLWYLSLFAPVSGWIVAGLAIAVCIAVLLGCALFAAAFFSSNSGFDQRVSDAARPDATLVSNPESLPDGTVFQRRTADFTADSVPAALLKDHDTKAGTWALIRVTEGALRYGITDERRPASSTVLTPDGAPGIVEPTILHHIAPIGEVVFHFEFRREPGPVGKPAGTRPRGDVS